MWSPFFRKTSSEMALIGSRQANSKRILGMEKSIYMFSSDPRVCV
jgi:hypothetical protein